MTLSVADSYHQFGYVPKLAIFDSAAAARFTERFDHLVADEKIDLAAPGFQLHDRHLDLDFVWDAATNRCLLDVVEQLVGPEIVLLGSRFVCKSPASALHVPWHRDATYMGLEPPIQVNGWLAVDDADLTNGCVQVLPRNDSQAARLRPHKPPRADADFVEQEIELTAAERRRAVPAVLSRGEMLIFDGDVVHGSASTKSARRRCGFVLRFAPVRAKLTNEGQWAAVLVRGDPAKVDPRRVSTRESARAFQYKPIMKFPQEQGHS